MKKNRLNRNTIYKYSFFTLILLYFLYSSVWGLIFSPPLTGIAQYDQLDIEREYECIFIRQESVIEAPGEGKIKFYVSEGEKVPRGFKVAEIYTSNVDEKEKYELAKLNERIEEIKSQENSLFD